MNKLKNKNGGVKMKKLVLLGIVVLGVSLLCNIAECEDDFVPNITIGGSFSAIPPCESLTFEEQLEVFMVADSFLPQDTSIAPSAHLIERIVQTEPESALQPLATIRAMTLIDRSATKERIAQPSLYANMSLMLVADTIISSKLLTGEKNSLIQQLNEFVTNPEEDKVVFNDDDLCPYFQATAEKYDLSLDGLMSLVGEATLTAEQVPSYSREIVDKFFNNPEFLKRLQEIMKKNMMTM